MIAAVVVIGGGAAWVSCGLAKSPSPTSSVVGSATSVTAPTAVPTLDFFRGRSYPTPTAQSAGKP